MRRSPPRRASLESTAATVKLAMALPLSVGADQLIRAEASPAIAETPKGTSGTVPETGRARGRRRSCGRDSAADDDRSCLRLGRGIRIPWARSLEVAEPEQVASNLTK